MQVYIKPREFSKSMKCFNRITKQELTLNERVTVRSSMQQKIDLLKVPVYEKKVITKKMSPNFVSSKDYSKTVYTKTKKIIPTDDLFRQNQSSQKTHYKYRSTHGKKSIHSWFRKASGNLEETRNRKNVIDIVIMEKQIEKDSMCTPHQRNSSMMNLKQNVSKMHIANQDSQSLIRKNSLYLLNFIKRKQKSQINKKSSEPHIGGIPNLATHMNINYEPYRKSQQTSTKSTNRKTKIPEQIKSSFSKILNNLLIQPW